MPETIAAYMKREGGFLAYEDMANHQSDWVEPVSTNYRGFDIWELPPNGQGIAALQILNILEQYDLKSYGFGSKEHLHYFLESKKIVYEDRAKFYADPDFNTIPINYLISKEYAVERKKLINKERAGRTFPAGIAPPDGGDTIYLTVADQEGNMVSFIQSNYRWDGIRYDTGRIRILSSRSW